MITQTARRISGFAFTFTKLAMLAALVLISACGTQTVQTRAQSEPQRSPVRVVPVGERAVQIALTQVGVPYRYGGSTSSGFDCSGLVYFAYGRAGKSVPRTTGQLWSATTPVQPGQIRVGDLLFFSIEGKMSHVGMYIGDRKFVHAPSSGRTVTVANLNSPFYSAAFLRAGRP